MTKDEFIAWRQRLGFTQAEAAEALGVKLRTLEGWEYGRGGKALKSALLERACREIEAAASKA